MNLKKIGWLSCLALSLSASAPLSHAGDAAAGKEKAVSCAACHGENGNSPNTQFPKLGGQHEDYLANALLQYQNGQRKNAIMAGLAAALSDEDRKDLAAYFASQESELDTLELE